MGLLYTTKTWTISGEQEFDGYFTLLNPQIKIQSVNFNNNTNVSISLEITENGGLFKHYAHLQYVNSANENNINTVVNAAVANAFPNATESA
jgi:hypothetical protein